MKTRLLMSGITLAVALAAGPIAVAATSFVAKGVYVLIDPFASGSPNLAWLDSQATKCIPGNINYSSCAFTSGLAKGVFLHVHWSDFQPTNTDMHYSCASQSGGSSYSATAIRVGSTEKHFCTSYIDDALTDIATISSNVGVTLNLSIGLVGGGVSPSCYYDLMTPNCVEGTLSATTTTTIPKIYGVPDWEMAAVSASAGGNGAIVYAIHQNGCVEEPDYWNPGYISDYSFAAEALITFTNAKANHPHPINILKVTGVDTEDLELHIAGKGTATLAGCTTTDSGATAWLYDHYTTQKVQTALASIASNLYNFVSANACNNGSIIPYLSFAVENTNNFPQIECTGTNESTGCTILTASSTPVNLNGWGPDFMSEIIYNLFNTNTVNGLTTYFDKSEVVVQHAGISATMPTTSAGMYTNGYPEYAATEVACQMANTSTNNATGINTIIGAVSPNPQHGPGTWIAWQFGDSVVQYNPPQTTDATAVIGALQNGINFGGQFIELFSSDMDAITSSTAGGTLSPTGVSQFTTLTAALAAQSIATCPQSP